MTAAVSLQAVSATALMRAVSAEGAARREPFPADLVGKSWDPLTCEPALLDWLANAMSVDIWDPSWDVLRKRAAVVASPELHRLKGTLEGIRRHLADTGATLRQAVTPRTRIFATPVVDKATRDAWLARMAQIRVYLADEQGKASSLGFVGSRGAFAGRLFAGLDAVDAIYGRRAVLVDGETVTPLRRSRIETTMVESDALELDRVFIPGGTAPALYAGRAFLGRAFLAEPVTPSRIVTYALRRSYSHASSALHLDTISPGLEPREVGYERISETGRAGLAQFAGRGPGRRFATADRAPWLLYDRILLQDGKRDAPWVRAHSFAGHARLGPPAFTASLLVDAPGRLQRRAAVARSWIAGRSVAAPTATPGLVAAIAAVRTSKAHRDRVLVDGATFRPRTLADRIPLNGSFRFGGLIPRTL